MRRFLIVIGTLSLVAFVPAVAHADWMDDFESYAVGTSLDGVGGWFGWDNDPAATAYVSDLYAHGGSNSVEILPTSDLVQRYSGYASGMWVYTAWMYIPTDFTGETFFIMLNTYAGSTGSNWSVQVHFTAGQVIGDSVTGATLPWITGQWVELRLEIDLTNDMQIFYYGGNVLYSASWTEGVSGGGVPVIAAVDLFGNGASNVYYDDMSLMPASVAVEGASWGNVKSLFRE